ncbi:SRPBCC family protein [Sphingomonas sp. SM33]|uniref:SRPBCC family protein n=1 Tax=Sphingomonas telluris TaxID=2907998 RepID=A0ABS9VMK5_9SPHN|nr:SRPBCC family protein [Sphingomonas telluris]MCH8615933.1 SRPBCC family protein [Sphingomonas telluris]
MTEATAQVRAPLKKIAPNAIRLERVLDAPAEKVWRYLTEADLRSQWFMGGTDARPDRDFELLNDHDNLSDDDVPYPENYAEFKGRTWSEKVLRFDPPRLLETTFQGGKNGTVTYELKPEGERTRLVVTHSGIESPTGFQDFGSGWNSHLTVLEERLAGRSIRNFWELHAQSREAVKEALEG